MDKHRSLTTIVATLLFLSTNIAVKGFSAHSSSGDRAGDSSSPPQERQAPQPREFVEITNPINLGSENRLPASFVKSWPTWVLEENDDGTCLVKIPDDDGFVNPASMEELWHPIDIQRPLAHLALGIHVREGSIRQVMPAVDLCYQGGKHRNRGMCSVPRAYGWIEFSNSLDEWDKYEIVLEERKLPPSSTESDSPKPLNAGGKWTQISSSKVGSISKAIERAMLCLAESPPAELGVGSHFIHILLDDVDVTGNKHDEKEDNLEGTVAVECPKAGFEMRVTMHDDALVAGRETAPGIMQVAVSTSMSGSESKHLPDVYNDLFHNPVYENPLYAKFRQRRKAASKEGGPLSADEL